MAQGDDGQVAWLEELVQEEVRHMHAKVLETSGGMFGEHTSSLDAACARPFQSAFGEEMYATIYEKVAALFHAIISDHPFAEGNKRTATVTAISSLSLELPVRSCGRHASR